jgi:hypothetical protein
MRKTSQNLLCAVLSDPVVTDHYAALFKKLQPFISHHNFLIEPILKDRATRTLSFDGQLRANALIGLQ